MGESSRSLIYGSDGLWSLGSTGGSSYGHPVESYERMCAGSA